MGFLKGATFSSGVIHNTDSKAGVGSTTSFYAGATLPTPITMLKVGASFDELWETATFATYADAGGAGAPLFVGGGRIWDIAAYATIQATDKLSFNGRFEYLNDNSAPGDAVALYSTDQFNAAGAGLGPNRNAAEELTATIQYNLWANVMTRAEFRWDHVEHDDLLGADTKFPTPAGGPAGGASFRDNDFLLALNIIYQF
jgi:hypothetical protein